ncbi:hypothetical protein, partial [Salmonella enterica]|uniref:hypothetical protein n=1 Tax=Salmonella enterica TaxID=28901 RepID=UPI001F45480C
TICCDLSTAYRTASSVVCLYAFNAFEQRRFGEAVAAWEMMLKLLPAGDARRAVIERSIRLAQEK